MTRTSEPRPGRLYRRPEENAVLDMSIARLFRYGVTPGAIAVRLAVDVKRVARVISEVEAMPAPAPVVVSVPDVAPLRGLPAGWGLAEDTELLRTGGRYADIAILATKHGVMSRTLLARWHVLRRAR